MRYAIFFIAWAATALVALIWPVTVLWVCRKCLALALTVFRNEVTYTVIHLVFFPIAFGLFASVFVVTKYFPTDYASLGLLVLMLLFMSYVSWSDLSRGLLHAHELPNACKELNDDATFNDAVDSPAHEALKKRREKAGLADIWRKGNCVALVAAVLTLLLQLTCAFILWYMFIVILHDAFTKPPLISEQVRLNFVAVLVLLCTWIPARAYANHCLRKGKLMSIRDDAVTFATIVAAITFCTLFVIFLVQVKMSFEVAVATLGILLSALAFVFVQVPAAASAVKEKVTELTGAMLITIGLVAVIALVAVMCYCISVNRV